ncbi:TerC/Alx family metal homeostasis membrane protein [Clostridium botulinum]|uniref:TerC/Alx family metal homeostasis membrane protein n=1 Tax=Clostridium botulinum TaxID=1491 RepID=UPI0007734B42|nr:TerC/Alx family metal homeostasis membrane protein [Clostridium botulinum]NFE95260.1 TerC/Alx family metal homeostasis membrane protein [Clostridium botulinum]NFL38640.1 TerC/Alx family metal homeostasis membrane protein [Clostridium botulinum]NFL66606.1 TerC/Alx family metal homeostasis membrane protein [Clostridium botulinum]NFN08557.1 TerC/Alx family metal homeostasis membrane protein [Clostridium botulinum]NFN24292.1 TerC/Alx family metal homeostasis membrane protein [Clostridium botuli
METKRSLRNLSFWIILSILFNLFIFHFKGEGAAIEYFGGYIIEMSLSLDNLFLFLMIFSSFGIREEYQERVLLYGVIGAMVLRLIFILLGVTIVNKFHWILYVFGVVLLFSGFKMLFCKDDNIQFHDNFAVKLLRKIMPVSNTMNDNRFFERKNKILYATPLFVVLLVIEFSDVIFALDSIPAIFSITTDTFIVYTSNIFAILGLRSMYYVLAKMNSMFRFMKYGVGFILMFTGVKLIIIHFGIEISVLNSVLIIMIILLTSILFSLLFDGNKKEKRC